MFKHSVQIVVGIICLFMGGLMCWDAIQLGVLNGGGVAQMTGGVIALNTGHWLLRRPTEPTKPS